MESGEAEECHPVFGERDEEACRIAARGYAREEAPRRRYGTRRYGWRSGVRWYPSPVAVCRRGLPRAAPDELFGGETARVAA